MRLAWHAGRARDMDSAASMPTVADIVRHHGRTRPDRVALYFEGQSVSYSELDRRASRVAQGLIAAGIKPQARVAILAKNDLAFFELWFGATKPAPCLSPSISGWRRQKSPMS